MSLMKERPEEVANPIPLGTDYDAAEETFRRQGYAGRRHGGRRPKMLYARYFHDVTGVSAIHGGKNDQQGKIYRYCEGVDGNIEVGQLRREIDGAS